MYTPGKLRHQIKSFSSSSEFRPEREKVLSASGGEEMYTPGKLRHQIRPSRCRASSGQIKSFSPSSEFRQDKILLVLNEFRYGVKGGRSLKDS